MKTLLCIHSYPSAKETVRLFWPHYKLPGWDIVGIDAVNGSHEWPENAPHVGIGRNEGYNRYSDNLIHKLIGTYEYVLNNQQYADVADICIIEHDSIFLSKPPPHPGGLFSKLAGGFHMSTDGGFGYEQVDGTIPIHYYHCPWWVDRKTAEFIVTEGRKLLAQGKIGLGSPDVFLGLLFAVHGKTINDTGDKTFSVNSGDFNNRLDQAEKAIKNGLWHIHGIKDQNQLEWVLSRNPVSL